MASIKRKSAAVAIAVVGVAGLSLASAAQLNVDAASLGAGADVVAACQEDLITVGFLNEYQDDLGDGGYATTDVTLAGVLVTCDGQSVDVTVADEDGLELATGSGTAATGTTEIALDSSVDAELIEYVAVVISG